MENILPKICQKGSYAVQVEAGQRYSWCSCGLSATQPFCDGAHKGKTDKFKSVKFDATETKTVYLCGCKHSKNGVYCDGTHKTL